MQVNIQIDEETAEKLLYIQQQTDRDRAEILQIAVAEYYNKLIQTKKTPFELLESAGFIGGIRESDQQEQANTKPDDWSDFIGSITAEPDLAENHKTYLRNELDKKYETLIPITGRIPSHFRIFFRTIPNTIIANTQLNS